MAKMEIHIKKSGFNEMSRQVHETKCANRDHSVRRSTYIEEFTYWESVHELMSLVRICRKRAQNISFHVAGIEINNSSFQTIVETSEITKFFGLFSCRVSLLLDALTCHSGGRLCRILVLSVNCLDFDNPWESIGSLDFPLLGADGRILFLPHLRHHHHTSLHAKRKDLKTWMGMKFNEEAAKW